MSNNDQPVPLAASLERDARLYKNQGKYLGETIQIRAVLEAIHAVALKHGWRSECFLREEDFCLVGYQREQTEPRKRVYISAGIHGDEPAGPIAVLELLKNNDWPDFLSVSLCPVLNPTGFPLNARENAGGLDLNRQYHQPQAPETRAHTLWLEKQPAFDVAICLHEDWESHGFYVYELNLTGQRSYAEEIIRRVAPVCPIDPSPVIEGREAHNGIIRPTPDPATRPQWPEAFYLITNKTKRSYTLEAPSDFPLRVRVAALTAGVGAILEELMRIETL